MQSESGSGPTRRTRNPFIPKSAGAEPPAPPPVADTADPGTAPAPEAQAEPAQFGRAEVVVCGTAVRVSGMAASDFSVPPHDPLLLSIAVHQDADRQWQARVSWPRWEGPGVAVFRVIAADGQAPASAADNAEATLAVTDEDSIVDSAAVNPPLAAARYYEVWAYLGPDVERAVASPPYLYAGGGDGDKVVWPPMDLVATAEGNHVVLGWRALADQRFRVGRRTIREARLGRPSSADCDDVPGHGYVDPDVVQGERYVYFVYAGARTHQAVEWSQVPSRAEATLPVLLTAVMDLSVTPQESRPVVDLSWTSVPVGRVEIYRSEKRPPADIHAAGQVELDALQGNPYNLDLTRPVPNPTVTDAHRSVVRSVDVSTDQAAVYFTPVTRFGTQGRPGRPVSWLRADPPSELVVADRVDRVLVAFKWPPGAARVDLWRTQVDAAPPDPERDQPMYRLGRDEYDAFGGFLIKRDLRFRSGACALHLAGFSQHGQTARHSPVATIRGRFPVLVYYWIHVEQRKVFRGVKVRHVIVMSSMESLDRTEFALIWSPDLLPLCRSDGETLSVRPVTLQPRLQAEYELGGPLPTHGFIRLIADPRNDPPVAVIDPPLAQLRLS